MSAFNRPVCTNSAMLDTHALELLPLQNLSYSISKSLLSLLRRLAVLQHCLRLRA